MSHSRKLSRNVAQFLAKSSPDSIVPQDAKGTPFKNRRHVETFERGGKMYTKFMRVTKGFHTERVTHPAQRDNLVSWFMRAARA